MEDFNHLKIRLKYIKSATNNFASNKEIGYGAFGKVYKGELSILKGQLVAFKRLDRKNGHGDTEFWREIMMLSTCRHENVVSLLHFCTENHERILVYEYASRGSLDRYLSDPGLSWTQRLKICLGVAYGLSYLHDPTETKHRVLHRDIKSSNILLNDDWTPKISDFGLSKNGPPNQPHTYAVSNFVGTLGYCDPLYLEMGLLSKESDVYSFGVVLFEVMCGRLCYEYENGSIISILVHFWKNCYDEDRIDDIIYQNVKAEIDYDSLMTFSAIANRCLNRDRKKRPTMAEVIRELEAALQQQNFPQKNSKIVKIPVPYISIKEFHHLKIRLEEITLATDNFNRQHLIGRGGFGRVYKGELSRPEGRSTVAFKCLNRQLGQGDAEFWKEIQVLSKYRHENLVSLLHFCDEGRERILVYEYVSRGSLDRYLGDISLTWTQRLKICVGAAHALNYLHNEEVVTVVHRDIKSSNILLDENWGAKVSDFGLSKDTNEEYIVTKTVGTPGYVDPNYFSYGLLTKESDVYAFGVVLFEVMCGRLVLGYDNGRRLILLHTWKECYDTKRLDEIIFPGIKEQMELGSLNLFSDVAYGCLNQDRKERPTMTEVVEKLETALRKQEYYEEMLRIADAAVFPLSYTSQSQLLLLISKGILVNDGKTWLSTNKNGEICEMISSINCIFGSGFRHDTIGSSRFSNILKGQMHDGFKVEVSTQFLSPHVTYSINLVFKHSNVDQGTHIPFKFKLDMDTKYSNSCMWRSREDGWLMIELHQFTSDIKDHKFRIQLLPLSSIYFSSIEYFLQGVEFRPVEYAS